MAQICFTRPVKIFPDGTRKANLDIEIVLDMFATVDNFDVAVLVSGDGDFERALLSLRAKGKRFKVVSTNGKVARELRIVSGMHYIDVASIKNWVYLHDYSDSDAVIAE